MPNPNSNNTRFLLADCTSAMLPGIVWFGLIPLSLYLPNQQALDYSPQVLAPFGAMGALYTGFLWVLCRRLSLGMRSRLVAALFFLGLFSLIADMKAPLLLDPLLIGIDRIGEPSDQVAFTWMWAGVCGVLFLAIPWKIVRPVALAFVIVLAAAQSVHVALSLEKPPPGPDGPLGEATVTDSLESSRPDIFHITFDGMGGPAFWEALVSSKRQDSFEGFTYFPNNLSNYLFTNLSLPSYMTGTLLENSGMKAWRDNARRQGIIHAARQAGYDVHMYVPYVFFGHQDANRVSTYGNVLRHHEKLSALCRFADLWLVRAVPVFLRQEVYGKGMGLFSRAFIKKRGWAALEYRPSASREIMDQIIALETQPRKGPRYVYAHLYLPHPPYVFMEDCSYCPETSGWESQARCCVKLMADLVETLKQSGAYDNTLILFHADHGTEGRQPSGSSPFSLNLQAWENNLRGLSPQGAVDLARSLLFIKPPRSDGPVTQSSRITQLADLPATIGHLAGLPVPPGQGLSVFSREPALERDIHVYSGWRQKRPSLSPLIWGKNLFSGNLNHYSFHPDHGWKSRGLLATRWK